MNPQRLTSIQTSCHHGSLIVKSTINRSRTPDFVWCQTGSRPLPLSLDHTLQTSVIEPGQMSLIHLSAAAAAAAEAKWTPSVSASWRRERTWRWVQLWQIKRRHCLLPLHQSHSLLHQREAASTQTALMKWEKTQTELSSSSVSRGPDDDSYRIPSEKSEPTASSGWRRDENPSENGTKTST